MGVSRFSSGRVGGGPRRTWVEAGGSTPSIVCTDPFSLYTEADPTFGTGAIKDNSWQEIGSLCVGHLRITFGTGMTPGEGFYIPTGWPRLPKVGGATGAYAREIGSGVVVDASASNRTTPIKLFLDPAVDATRPFFMCPGKWSTITDGSDVEHTLYELNALPVVAHNVPFTFADGDAINITFAFEGV